MEKGKKRGGKREDKKGIVVKKDEKYPYFVFSFNISPYERKKRSAKDRKKFQNFQGGGEDFSGWP